MVAEVDQVSLRCSLRCSTWTLATAWRHLVTAVCAAECPRDEPD